MSGWKRAFALLAGLTFAAVIALVALDKPAAGASEQAYACFDVGFIEASRDVAESTLADPRQRATLPQACEQVLRAIADGSSHHQMMKWWWGEVRQASAVAVGFLLFVYLLGAAIGWVWRGFVPRQT